MSEEAPFPLHRVLEAILFASQKPVSEKEIAAIFKGAADSAKENPAITAYAKVTRAEMAEAIQQLETEYAAAGVAFEVRENAAGWQLVTRPDFAPWLRQLFPENRPAKLSSPALETLAIIAYRQPITRADLEAVRGVAVDGVMQTLLDRGLVRIAGRSELAGRALLYETTQYFMEHFGLKDLDDLPNANELRRIALPQAPRPPEPEPSPQEELPLDPPADEPSADEPSADESAPDEATSEEDDVTSEPKTE